MKIVHVLHGLDVGGTENGAVNVIDGTAADFEHVVVSMTDLGPLAARLPEGVTAIPLHRRRGVDVRVVGRLTGLLRRLRPDVVHSRNWAAFDAVVAARFAGVPTVVHSEHGREITDPEGRNGRRNRIRRVLSPLVTRFVAVSRDLEGWLVNRVGIPRRKVLTIQNGVDVDRFTPDSRDKARRALGVSPDTVVIGTVGRLDPVKDQVSLIEAFAPLARQHPNLVAVLVGDGPHRGVVADRVSNLGISDRVRLLGRRMDVPVLLAGFDVFVLPSIAEGMSNTVLEAMAAGVPVVATRVGGSPEMVEDGVTGLLVPVGARRELADALGVYAADSHLRALHGKAGRARAVEQFSLGRMIQSYRHMYNSVGRR
jgi:sugar transferase (PEP-CTERM/EpsH1 system associated)